MKIKIYYPVLALFLFVLIAAFSFSNEGEKPSNNEVIKFSHQLHGEMMSCAECHTGVVESSSLSDRLLPEKDVCADCHDVDDDENCQMCHYEEVYEPLESGKSKLIFDHQFHGNLDELECESCHTGLDEVDYSFESKSVLPGMSQCYTCHNENAVATNACEACHIETHDLLPETHAIVNFLDNHRFMATEMDANCAMCHDDDFCGTCHESTTMLGVANTASDFYTPYSPHTYTDGIKQQQITRAHDLTYRFTHGIDAKGKTNECSTCHNQETFCVECHNMEGGDIAIEGFVPHSHSVDNFVTFGVGTGGGEHAVQARRDIENCASCHDTQGADPNCILCHTDPDGIKGTNPRTHETSFMSDLNGDWHNDDGSVCYNCHTDAFATAKVAGNGFCGYCHGANVD